MSVEKTSFAKEVWQTFSAIDVTNYIEKKQNLTYIKWSLALGTLFEHYPESDYTFDDVVTFANGTQEVWVTVTVREGEQSISRKMWLPVLDYKNKAIVNADSMAINTARMRCLTKCIAVGFGLGGWVYGYESIPQPMKISEMTFNEIVGSAARSDTGKFILGQEEYDRVCEILSDSIQAIKDGVEENDALKVQEAIAELSEDEQIAIWRAPTKGGCFTKEEIEFIKQSKGA